MLLTNLATGCSADRYDLGDSVLAKTDPCECGSPLPAIRVAGRRDDVLRLVPRRDRAERAPLAIGSVVDETPGLHRSQLSDRTGEHPLGWNRNPEPMPERCGARGGWEYSGRNWGT